jgi:hypothetical protein
VKAYKIGALRASIASIWVSIVYDLIAKYRELTVSDDPAARTFIDLWDNATAHNDIRKLLELERGIIEDATSKTQIIDPLSKKHLDRIREDRHLCAHPAFSSDAELFEPSPELVRLHLVSAVDLVLSRKPLQGKAIIETYSIDVRSAGFPSDNAKILDYVERRYLERVRAPNIRGFGAVLAKSLLKGVPVEWEHQQNKVISSLVAVRERAVEAWPDVSSAIVRLIDTLEPNHRLRAITFIAAFPDFWPLLQEPTRMALQATVDNADPAALSDFRILKAGTVLDMRHSVVRLIDKLNEKQLAGAISALPLSDLWPRAIKLYRESGSYRGSEANFRNFILPFAGHIKNQWLDQLLDAVIANGQNSDAALTETFLIELLSKTEVDCWPSLDARNRFCLHFRRKHWDAEPNNLLTLLQSDGWVLPPSEPEPED